MFHRNKKQSNDLLVPGSTTPFKFEFSFVAELQLAKSAQVVHTPDFFSEFDTEAFHYKARQCSCILISLV